MSQDGASPQSTQQDHPKSSSNLSDVFAQLIDTQARHTTDPGVSENRESDTYLKVFQDTEAQRQRHREILTPALRNIAHIWTVAVLLLLITQGFGSKSGFFTLSDKVLITLITTTTANILGLFYIAVRYLYANPDFKSPRMQRQD